MKGDVKRVVVTGNGCSDSSSSIRNGKLYDFVCVTSHTITTTTTITTTSNNRTPSRARATSTLRKRKTELKRRSVREQDVLNRELTPVTDAGSPFAVGVIEGKGRGGGVGGGGGRVGGDSGGGAGDVSEEEEEGAGNSWHAVYCAGVERVAVISYSPWHGMAWHGMHSHLLHYVIKLNGLALTRL
ncbi:hypothetical protein M0804_005239 [Polistes exclamans]|nr:hypothetical protein M0804_005239 [Polistes exclamans]